MWRATILSALLLLTMTTGCGDNTPKEDTPIGAAMSEKKILIDDAAILGDDPKFVKAFHDYNEALLKDFDIDFRVVTTISEKDIDRFANGKFAELQKESRSRSGKALLLVINPVQDRVRLEVSQALEPVYTDALVSYVERKGMVPYFRDDKVADGAFMMMELIRDRAYEAREGKEFIPPMESRSIGGGAKTEAKIGQKDPDAKKGAQVEAREGEDPKGVMQRYIQALKSHNTNPRLDIYTDATKRFFEKWTVTEINQDHEVHNLAPCLDRQEILYDSDRTHAVLAVRPYDKYRKCSPYFFKKEDGRWKLDIASMAQMLRFNKDMLWHFDTKKRLKGEGIYYAFAFDGYWLDRHGYPHTVSEKEKKPDDARWGFQCKPWYRPGENPKELTRCWIALVWPGSPAQVRLGMDVYDYVTAVGEGADRVENVSYKGFLEYMAGVPSGKTATVEVERYRKGKKYPYRVIRRGVAP